MSLSVCLFDISSKTAISNDLKFLRDGSRLKNIQIRPAVRRKTEEKNANDTSYNPPYIDNNYSLMSITLRVAEITSSTIVECVTIDLEEVG